MSKSLVFQTILCLSVICNVAQAADQPATSFPYTPGLDVNAMDKTANPCEDFYQYSCGGWMKNNPIPADQPRWSVYGKLTQDNQRYLWGILDTLAKNTTGRNPRQQQIGNYFAACMDEGAVETLGAKPLTPHFGRIAAMKSKGELASLLARLQLDMADSGFFFGFGSNQDFADSSKVIAFASSGGLSLPDRDYYLKTEDSSKQIRDQFTTHVARVFELLGDTAETAKRNAEKVIEMETAMAAASLSRVDRRDPRKLFHNMDANGLKALTPGFDWNAYLRVAGLSKLNAFNVTEPEYFKALEKQWRISSLDDIKTYLRWHVTHANAPYLSSAFVNENFNFFSKTLRGVPELRPRWKRCVALVDGQLGEALGQEFVSRTFSAELKNKTSRMTRQIEQAMQQDLNNLSWMSAPTKLKALEKLHSIVNKIGYPDKWRDYSSVVVKRDDFMGNV